ncbi:MAG: hypothetical protein K2X27_25945 [Candidatus Obscuribacterales bacterium]|nr:hypothetical protein [Candidatus Obscuribacterales bacterium]
MAKAYDKAKWHYEGDYPADLPIEQAFVHTGMYLAWLVEQDLLEREFAEEIDEELGKFRNREITGPQLYELLDGVLSDEMLSKTGNEFTLAYFDAENAQFITDYEELLAENLASVYQVEDSWENYSKLKQRIDERYRKWKLQNAVK